MAISTDAMHHQDGPVKKSLDVSGLMENVKTPSDCANLSLRLVQEGKPKEGYQVLLDGMKRFDGTEPSLTGLLNQYRRGGVAHLIREQEQREELGLDK